MWRCCSLAEPPGVHVLREQIVLFNPTTTPIRPLMEIETGITTLPDPDRYGKQMVAKEWIEALAERREHASHI